MKRLQCLIILVGTFTTAFGQKVAPGVPPQHYMDPSLQHNQHYQQVPQMQYVQPGQPQVQQMPHVQQPVQHAQVPVAHQQQMPQMNVQHDPNMHQQQHHPQQHQQQPQQQLGGAPHQGHRLPQQVLDTSNIQGEKAHIQEHFEVPIDTSKMTEQELQFHYFKMHDSDQNNKLDGCELIKSLIHWHEKSNKEAHSQEGHAPHQEKIFSDEELVALIDPILAMDDTGKDGYIDYPEFIKAQQKAAAQNKAEKP